MDTETVKHLKSSGFQPGIHKIDLQIVRSILGFSILTALVPDAIITFFNNNGGKSKNFEKYTLLPTSSQLTENYCGFSTECYIHNQSYQTAAQIELSSYSGRYFASTSRSSSVFFFVRGDEVFALTQGDGWRVVFRFSCEKFPLQIAKKILTPALLDVKFRHLRGRKYSSYSILRKAHQYYSSEGLDKIVKLCSAKVRNPSPLEKLFQKEKIPGKCLPKVTVSTRQIKFNRNLDLYQLSEIIDHLVDVQNGNLAYEDDPFFDFLDMIKPVSPSLNPCLESELEKQIQKKMDTPETLELDFCYREEEKFMKAEKYRFKLLNGDQAKKSKSFVPSSSLHPTYIINELKSFLKYPSNIDLTQVKFCFKVGNHWTEEPFLDYFHGEINCNEKKYFKISGRWFQVSEDWLKVCHSSFQQCLKFHLIDDPNHPAALSEKWTDSKDQKGSDQKALRSNDEDLYNKKYEGKSNFIVGDKELVDYLELFDLLKIEKDETGQYCLYLYHVKKGMGQHTRDAASQILNASEVIAHERNSNTIEGSRIAKLAEKLVEKGKIQPNEKDKFINAFRNNKICFVFACMNGLKKQGVLKHERDRSLGAKSYLSSTIMRNELVKLSKQMRKTNFRFYIFEIEKDTDTDADANKTTQNSKGKQSTVSPFFSKKEEEINQKMTDTEDELAQTRMEVESEDKMQLALSSLLGKRSFGKCFLDDEDGTQITQDTHADTQTIKDNTLAQISRNDSRSNQKARKVVLDIARMSDEPSLEKRVKHN